MGLRAAGHTTMTRPLHSGTANWVRTRTVEETAAVPVRMAVK
jgi:hypothetical protein